MTNHRYREIMNCCDARLTEPEIALDWHFCDEFDGLLVGPESFELHFCHCLPKDHPVYKTTPPMPDITINENEL